jgi:hypothetical protein
MEPFIMKEYPDYIFHMKDGKCILQYNKKNGYVYVSYEEIWKFFESYFSMSNQQIKDITKIWVEEHYKMGVTATSYLLPFNNSLVEEHYKMGVTTTVVKDTFDGIKIEEQYKEIQTTNNQLEFYSERDVEELYEQNTNGK